MAKIEDFRKKILENIEKKSKAMILRTIDEETDLHSWNTLYNIKQMASGKHTWVVGLVNSLLRSLIMLRAYEQEAGTESMNNKLEAVIEKGAEEGMTMDLGIRGIDDISSRNLRAITYGGEMDIEGEIRVVDKHTQIDETEIEKATDDLREWFVKRFEKETIQELKELGEIE